MFGLERCPSISLALDHNWSGMKGPCLIYLKLYCCRVTHYRRTCRVFWVSAHMYDFYGLFYMFLFFNTELMVYVYTSFLQCCRLVLVLHLMPWLFLYFCWDCITQHSFGVQLLWGFCNLPVVWQHTCWDFSSASGPASKYKW